MTNKYIKYRFSYNIRPNQPVNLYAYSDTSKLQVIQI